MNSEYYKVNATHIKERNRIRWATLDHKWKWAKASIWSHKKDKHDVRFNANDLHEKAKDVTRCPICNTELDWTVGGNKKGKSSNNSPSLDRTDNAGVLTLDNVQIICRQCNTTKGARTMEEFIKYCKLVAERHA